MDKKRVELIRQQFDVVVHSVDEENIEFWYARELMPLLSYERWGNFDKAISRAIASCQTSGIEVSDHFRDLTKMVQLGIGSKRDVKDNMLMRYGIRPEELLPSEDIKKLERRVKTQEKKIAAQAGKLPEDNGGRNDD